MTPVQAAALESLRQAVAGKPLNSYVEYAAGDVQTLAPLVRPEPNGAVAVLLASVVGLKPHDRCVSYTHAVSHLTQLATAEGASP